MKTYNSLNELNKLQPLLDEICIRWINENQDNPYIQEQFCNHSVGHSTLDPWDIVNWLTVCNFSFMPGQASSLGYFRLWSDDGDLKLYKEELMFVPEYLAKSLIKACMELA